MITPFVILRLAWLGLSNHDYWQRWSERFGYIPLDNDQRPVLWIHAVSVGEVHASMPVVNHLLATYPEFQLVITTTTPTGAQSVKNHFGDTVKHFYLSYDLPGAVKRFVSRLTPQMLMVMETEIWPNLFQCCNKLNIDIVLVNARMSEKSAKRYSRLSHLARSSLSDIRKIAAQTEADAKRLITLGALPENVIVTGNLKFDIKLPHSLIEEAQSLRRTLSVNRPIWIAASTHEGEEEKILIAYNEVLSRHKNCLLIIAPRHPERSGAISGLCKKHHLATIHHSQGKACHPSTQVYILDTLGDLPLFYAASDIAFVGGSLVPGGGHNVLEPACLGLPVLIGPHTYNFLEICHLLEQQGAAWRVMDSDQLASQVIVLLSDANLRHYAGEKGRQMVEENRGSSKQVIDLLDNLISGGTSRKN